MPMIVMTTNNSTNVKPCRGGQRPNLRRVLTASPVSKQTGKLCGCFRTFVRPAFRSQGWLQPIICCLGKSPNQQANNDRVVAQNRLRPVDVVINFGNFLHCNYFCINRNADIASQKLYFRLQIEDRLDVGWSARGGL